MGIGEKSGILGDGTDSRGWHGFLPWRKIARPSPRPDSAVRADQVKSLDWRSRQATQKGAVGQAKLAEVRAKILALIGALPPTDN